MTRLRALSWANFCDTVFITGQQRIHRALQSPTIDIIGDGIQNVVGIQLQADVTELPPAVETLGSITGRVFSRKQQRYFELLCTSPALHRQFYHFAVALAERIAAGIESADQAVAEEIESFGTLLKERSILSAERQIGLAGELLFLRRLLPIRRTGAVDAWLGPEREPHDFRFEGKEFEVKSTVLSQRVHTINRSQQVQPSTGCELYIVSVVLGPPGQAAGFTLPSLVAHIESGLGANTAARADFQRRLQASGYVAADASLYRRRYALRRPIGLVNVDESFPALTLERLKVSLGEAVTRVEAVWYEVDLEGLEVEDGSPMFNSILS